MVSLFHRSAQRPSPWTIKESTEDTEDPAQAWRARSCHENAVSGIHLHQLTQSDLAPRRALFHAVDDQPDAFIVASACKACGARRVAHVPEPRRHAVQSMPYLNSASSRFAAVRNVLRMFGWRADAGLGVLPGPGAGALRALQRP